MSPLRSLVLLALALAALAGGCGGSDGTAEPQQAPARGYGGGAGLTVAEAIRAGGSQVVHGSLVAREGETRLCSMLLESHPPQCGEPSLRVEGLDLDAVAGTTSAAGVTWSEREVSLHGRVVEDEVLRVSD